MQAILDAIQNGQLEAEIVMVLSDIPDAYILERAGQAGLPTGLIDCRGLRSKFPEDAQREAADILKQAGAELICLAGFMRLLRSPLLDAFPGRIINIHPSLLPKYGGKGMYGLNVHRSVIKNNDSESGFSIHYVNKYYDEGNIIFQKTVKVDTDDPLILANKVLIQEHKYYPEIIKKILYE